MYENLAKAIINDYNGTIKPLIISGDLTNGTGICNPSIFVEDDKIQLILRHVNILYILVRMTKNINQHSKDHYLIIICIVGMN